ncbi:hypothetical protein B0H10DRAFT_2164639 [Mycena sp. CBHHK59/15]|nr:hypothetical protein B0H10DRAFT_2164639 [Mycena sp. CBHHK59/15]
MAVAMNIPASPSSKHMVSPNFLGISFELSFIPNYMGNDTSAIPQPMINYLANIRARTGAASVRVRIGGNSADGSDYFSSQTTPMAILNNPHANPNDQSVNYGPEIWSTMAKVAQMAGGVDYLIGVPILDPNNTTTSIVADAKAALGDSLDAVLLGNEPDLYQAHGKRPNVTNYTFQIYENKFFHSFAGPTICCSWDLASLLQQGYLTNLTTGLKYITLQHYPQNNCGLGVGQPRFGLAYYMRHSSVVSLAAWQGPGAKIITSNSASNAPRLVLSEFNSASCGGIPGLSDTFAVGSLWTLDYALQMASIGFSATYLHTRERGISYNLVTPPAGGNGALGNWTTNPPYYAMLAMAEALRTEHGGIVIDLDLDNSTTDDAALQAGYAVYDAHNSLPASLFANRTAKTALVKFLASATGAREKTHIAWGAKTFAGVGNGKSAVDAAWAPANQHLACAHGCSFNTSGTSLALVFLDNAQFAAIPTTVDSPLSPSVSASAAPAPSTVASAGRRKFRVSDIVLTGLAMVVLLGLLWNLVEAFGRRRGKGRYR